MANCALSLTVTDGENPVAGVLVMARHAPRQTDQARNNLLAKRWKTATTDENGLATVLLEQGAKARILCEHVGLDVVFDVPSAATYDVADLNLDGPYFDARRNGRGRDYGR